MRSPGHSNVVRGGSVRLGVPELIEATRGSTYTKE